MEQASRGRKPYYELTSAMVKTGILGYGGGPSVIPLIRYEAVNHYGWMEDEEFGEILALANALPGPIATKIAAYLGYRQKGTPGAIVAVIAHILPSSLAMIALLSVVGYLSSSTVVQGMIAAVVPVVAVMIGLMAYEFAERAVKGLGKPAGFGFFALSLVMLEVIHIHAAIVIIAFLAYGAFHFKAVRRLRGKLGKRGTPDDGKEDGS
ncbi:chromate transporter [Paenibacillus chitinolyticus]|uniref:chromate transporter n=1 Tax=Paenibacillus chitinolyticus TaxID=79263 RepID=UPI001C459490|nr:chromate transporter [Paenibacillus chitinolyticus]MBV6713571.1 chromate transporter [Paenibacillus chitinolyticus]